MTNKQPKQRYEIGMIDLLLMGRILVLNKVNHINAAEGFNYQEVPHREPAELNFRSAANFLDCIRLLRKPNSMMMFVPARTPVYSVIEDLLKQFHLDNSSLAEVQLCLTRFNTGKKSQISRLKLLLERK